MLLRRVYSGGGVGKGLLIYNTQESDNVYANLDFRARNADGRIAYQYKTATNVGDFHFITDNTGSPASKMTIQNGGNVGIGTTNPAFKLQVQTPAVPTNSTYVVGLDVTRPNSANRGFTVGSNSAADTWTLGAHNADIQLGHTFGTDTGGQPAFYPDVTIKHSDQSVGSVGIGTSSPQTNLHVYGSGVDNGIAIARIGGLSNNTSILQLAETQNGSGEMTYGFSMRADGGAGGGSTNDFQLRYHNNSTAGVVGFTMDRISGNVGIGTGSPNHKLEVNGSFAATTKSFLIDHPTKENMRLQYGALEGPENGVYVRGRSTYKIIDLPDYWTNLVDEETITVQLTPIGSHQHLYVEKN